MRLDDFYVRAGSYSLYLEVGCFSRHPRVFDYYKIDYANSELWLLKCLHIVISNEAVYD